MPDDRRPEWARVRLWQIQFVRDLLVLAVVVALVWLGYAMRSVTVPLLVALGLAYLFDPLVSRLAVDRRVPLGRGPVVACLMGTVGLALIAAVALIVPLLVSQAGHLADDVQSGRMRERAEHFVEATLPESLQDRVTLVVERLPSGDDGTTVAAPPAPLVLPTADADWTGMLAATTGMVVRVTGRVVELGLLVVLIPIYFFFFSLWFPRVTAWLDDLVPRGGREDLRALARRMDRVVAGFVRGRVVISMVMGVMLAGGWMGCGVPYAVLLGLVTGIFCLVPFLGVVGLPVAVGLLWLDQLGLPEAEQMAWWAVMLWPTVVYAAVQGLEGWILTPLISGKTTNLDPVTIIVAVLAGGSVGGVYGMLLAIPVAACLRILMADVVLPRIRAWARGEEPDPLPIEES